MKITDESIDANTMRYWCVFSSREYREFFQYMEQQVAAAKGKKTSSNISSKKKSTNESIMSTVKEKIYSVWSSVKNYIKAKGRRIFNSGVQMHSVAHMCFEANGKKYTVSYNLKKQGWYLFYTNIGVFNTDSIPSEEEASSLKKTSKFKEFVEQCKVDMLKVIDNDTIFNVLIKAFDIVDKKTVKYLQQIKDSKDQIKQTMFKVQEIKL